MFKMEPAKHVAVVERSQQHFRVLKSISAYRPHLPYNIVVQSFNFVVHVLKII